MACDRRRPPPRHVHPNPFAPPAQVRPRHESSARVTIAAHAGWRFVRAFILRLGFLDCGGRGFSFGRRDPQLFRAGVSPAKLGLCLLQTAALLGHPLLPRGDTGLRFSDRRCTGLRGSHGLVL